MFFFLITGYYNSIDSYSQHIAEENLVISNRLTYEIFLEDELQPQNGEYEKNRFFFVFLLRLPEELNTN